MGEDLLIAAAQGSGACHGRKANDPASDGWWAPARVKAAGRHTVPRALVLALTQTARQAMGAARGPPTRWPKRSCAGRQPVESN
jgi:hypothetical protein